jgi:hypothetical protein
MAKQGSGTGQGGKTYNERQLAARVHNLALSEIEKVLKRRKGKLYEAVLIKFAGSVLPRLNEHGGDDGGPIVISWKK